MWCGVKKLVCMHIYSYIIQVLRFRTIEQHSIEKCISGGRAPHTRTARRREKDQLKMDHHWHQQAVRLGLVVIHTICALIMRRAERILLPLGGGFLEARLM